MKRTMACRLLALMTFTYATLSAADPNSMRMKVLAISGNGSVENIVPEEWKLIVDGKDAKIISQRGPQELSREAQKWVFIFLPIRGAEFRLQALQSAAEVMKTLPATDSVLLVVHTEHGLECFTPGFTSRPSLWALALNRMIKELPAGLKGSSQSRFVLPATPQGEPQEDMVPIQAFLKILAVTPPQPVASDVIEPRGVMSNYSPRELGGITRAATETLDSLANLGEVVAKLPGESHIVVFSRNEVDDLANPLWRRSVGKLPTGHGGYHTEDLLMDPEIQMTRMDNPKLQVELMIRDMTLATESLKRRFATLGLSIHSVAGYGEMNGGALGGVATSTGGFSFRFGPDLVAQFSKSLPMWAYSYELTANFPAGTARPAKVRLSTTRKGIKLFVPALQ